MIVKDADSSWGLILFDSKGSQFVEGEVIGPPICLVLTLILSSVVSGRELLLLTDVRDPGQKGVMHYQHFFVLGVNYI